MQTRGSRRWGVPLRAQEDKGLCGSRQRVSRLTRSEVGGPRLLRVQTRRQGVSGAVGRTSAGPDPHQEVRGSGVEPLRVQTRRPRGQGVGGGAPAGPDPQTKGSGVEGWASAGPDPQTRGPGGWKKVPLRV